MKKPFSVKDKSFNIKFLLCGNSGSGKTDLCARYTKGPVHFYMFDKGGEKTIEKIITISSICPPVWIEILSLCLSDLIIKIRQ